MFLRGRDEFNEKFYSVAGQALKSLEPCVTKEDGGLLLLLAAMKDLAVEAACLSGYRVINADNWQLSSGAGRVSGKVIYFSSIDDNILVRRHLGVGGAAVFVRDGQVLSATGGVAKPIAPAHDPANCQRNQGRLQDALAAAAAFLALGIQPGELWPGSGLKEQDAADPGSAVTVG
jgi:hypothetical protein